VRAEPGYWFFRIKEGGKKEPLARPHSAMPGWGDHLSDQQIWEVVAYLKSLAAGNV
jgi:mono/diheme cytochrome c family protein